MSATGSTATETERLLRELAPHVLGILVRRYGDFETCEDAVQEALLAAATQWPVEGLPGNPTGWLVTVAARRRLEQRRGEVARRRREQTAASLAPPEPEPAPAADDTLTLLLLCCHPALTPVSQVALTLRAVGGLTTAEIARALLVPEATVAQRISRAKRRIRDSGGRFGMPPPGEQAERLVAVRHVLYLIFNEGYTASSGSTLHRVDLTSEAIRLTRQLHQRLPDDGEVAGLLALMLLTDARRPARTGPGRALVPLAEQDRSRWDAAAIAEGTALVTHALATAPVGPYQLQAAIAAVHDEARTAADTDWPQILTLYDLLDRMAPTPMVTLGRVVGVRDGARPGGGPTPARGGGGGSRARRPSPAARRPRAPAGAGRRTAGGPHRVRAGRPPYAQRSRTALSHITRRAARGQCTRARELNAETIQTPAAATSTWRSTSIQSTPDVSPTSRALASTVPSNAPTMPTTMVSRIDMFCLPGRISRANAPITSPTTIAKMSEPTEKISPISMLTSFGRAPLQCPAPRPSKHARVAEPLTVVLRAHIVIDAFRPAFGRQA
jgi:RNA polymerase sigma factor (sigma-70 family)